MGTSDENKYNKIVPESLRSNLRSERIETVSTMTQLPTDKPSIHAPTSTARTLTSNSRKLSGIFFLDSKQSCQSSSYRKSSQFSARAKDYLSKPNQRLRKQDQQR
jgi:hypothetical protein